MARASTIQTNFTSGEVSPLITGRVDLTRYQNGAAIVENFLIQPQGCALRRSGTKFVNEVKEQSKFTKLVPFEFSTEQAYVLEFGDSYMRVYMDGGIVESAPSTPVEIVTPWDETEIGDISYTQSADVLYVCHPDYTPRKISRTSHTAWTIAEVDTSDGPYLTQNVTDIEFQLSSISDVETIINTVSEFIAGDVGDYIEYNKDGVPTLGLIASYVSGTEITITPLENIVDPLDPEVTFVSYVGTTLTVTHDVFTRDVVGAYIRADISGSITWHLITAYDGATRTAVTANAAVTVKAITGILSTKDRTITATLKATEASFVATDVGRHFRMNLDTDQVWGTISAFTSTTEVSVTVNDPVPLKSDDPSAYKADGKTKLWRLGAWSDTTGYPSVTTFHEQRLCLANTSEEPQTVWMSKSADYENFAPTELNSDVSDDNAITYTIASSKVNSISWLRSTQVLLIGTIGGEWEVKSSSSAEPVTPRNISVSQQTPHGSSLRTPERIGNAILFVQRAGNKVRELAYSFQVDSFVSSDLTIVSSHILINHGGAVDLAYQEDPDSLLWIALDDGQLACLTYIKEQDVYAWHRHVLGGDGIVESIASIPSDSGNTLYVIVKRTIDGSIVRYVEYISENFKPEDTTDKDEMYFLDSFLTYSGVAADTFSGLDHLEGEEVSIVAEGSVLPSETVSGGSVITEDLYTSVVIGLPYTSTLKTLPIEGGSEDGTSQGKIKRIQSLSIRLVDSLGFKHGTDLSDLIQLSFRESNDPMDVSPPLFTGDKTVEIEQGYETLAQYYIVQDQPYPLNILSLMPQFYTNTR